MMPWRWNQELKQTKPGESFIWTHTHHAQGIELRLLIFELIWLLIAGWEPWRKLVQFWNVLRDFERERGPAELTQIQRQWQIFILRREIALLTQMWMRRQTRLRVKNWWWCVVQRRQIQKVLATDERKLIKNSREKKCGEIFRDVVLAQYGEQEVVYL